MKKANINFANVIPLSYLHHIHESPIKNPQSTASNKKAYIIFHEQNETFNMEI